MVPHYLLPSTDSVLAIQSWVMLRRLAVGSAPSGMLAYLTLVMSKIAQNLRLLTGQPLSMMDLSLVPWLIGAIYLRTLNSIEL